MNNAEKRLEPKQFLQDDCCIHMIEWLRIQVLQDIDSKAFSHTRSLRQARLHNDNK